MNSEVVQILEHKRQIMQGKGAQPKRCACAAAAARLVHLLHLVWEWAAPDAARAGVTGAQ